MKLWDSLTTCLILLSAVRVGSLLRNRQQSAKRRGRAAEGPPEIPPVQIRLSVISPGTNQEETADTEDPQERSGKYAIEKPHPDDEDVIEFIKVMISRVRRSSSSASSSPTSSSSFSRDLKNRTRHRRERKNGAKQRSDKGKKMEMKIRRGGGSVRGQGCVLKQIHLNVSDLGLGYRSSEEMIFRYCSGPCRKSETNYDKILYNLVHKRKLPAKGTPLQACCRPIAFDDDLSFLDDSLIYHTVRKHSARKCGCV